MSERDPDRRPMASWMAGMPMVAQASAEGAPSWLMGTLEVPFWAVALAVGVLVCGGLVHYARRAATDEQEQRSEREARQRRAREHDER